MFNICWMNGPRIFIVVLFWECSLPFVHHFWLIPACLLAFRFHIPKEIPSRSLSPHYITLFTHYPRNSNRMPQCPRPCSRDGVRTTANTVLTLLSLISRRVGEGPTAMSKQINNHTYVITDDTEKHKGVGAWEIQGSKGGNCSFIEQQGSAHV